MAITLLGTSQVAPIGFVDVTPTNGTITLPAPTQLAVGHYYLIITHFQGLRGDNMMDIVPSGFIRLYSTSQSSERGVAIWAKQIENSTQLAAVQETPIRAGASSTRIVSFGLALSGVYVLNPIQDIGTRTSWSTATSAAAVAAATGSYVIGIAATNTTSYTGGTVISPSGGTKIAEAVAWATPDHASAGSTNLALLSGAANSVTMSAAPTTGTTFKLALLATSDVDPLGADPIITNRIDLAPIDDRPNLTWAQMTTSAPPSIPSSPGWLREKRVGVAENIPGGAQTSTADLDITGSTRFAYPSVPAAPAHAANPGNYVLTDNKPGGAPQAARWLFNVSFVVRGSDSVELRLRSGVASPSIGRIYVNGRPISDSASVATGIAAGVGYYVKMVFPTVATRIITIYGLNATSGSFGGAATGPGGTITKPTAPVKRRIAFIGDSFTNGSGSYPTGANPVETFAWRLGWLMGADEILQAGIGGTGWNQTVGGLPESTFAGRIAAVLAMNPHVVVFPGGRNDSPGVQAAVQSAIAAVSSVPEVYVIPTATDAQTAVRAEMQAGVDASGRAAPSGSPYIDIAQAGIPLGSDGIHPTFDGHQMLADRIWDSLQQRDKYAEPPLNGMSSFRIMEPLETNFFDPEYRGIGDVEAGWTLRNSTTPHSLANDTGSSGSASFSAPVRDDETDLLWNRAVKTIATVGERQFVTIGRINDVETSLDFLDVTHDDIRARLNVEVRTSPFEVQRRLSDMFDYYIHLAIPDAPVQFVGIGNAITDPLVSYAHWEGNCWEKLKELCTITRKRLHANEAGDGFIITDIIPTGSPVKSLDQFTDSRPALSPTNPDLVQRFSITNTNATTVAFSAKQVAYSAELQGETHDVDLLEERSLILSVPHSLTRVTQELPILDAQFMTPTQEGYIVTDSEGKQVTAAQWSLAGGRVTASVGTDPSIIDVTIFGPRVPIVNTVPPFKLQSPGDVPAPQLNIKGGGVFVKPETVTIYTGVNSETIIIRTGPSYESPFLYSASVTYDAAAWAAYDLSGPRVELRFAVGTESDLSVGDRVFYRWANWRITDMTFNSTGASVVAIPYTTVEEKDAIWAGRTVAEYDAFWAGRRVYDSKVRPLWSD